MGRERSAGGGGGGGDEGGGGGERPRSYGGMGVLVEAQASAQHTTWSALEVEVVSVQTVAFP